MRLKSTEKQCPKSSEKILTSLESLPAHKDFYLKDLLDEIKEQDDTISLFSGMALKARNKKNYKELKDIIEKAKERKLYLQQKRKELKNGK